MMDINNLVSLAAGMHASDIHISSGMTPKCRVDGAIKSISDELLNEKTVEEIARHLLGDNFDRVAKIGEADIGFTFPCGVRVRGNIYRQNRRLSIALRLFNNRIPTVEELGLPACAGVIPSIKNGIVLVDYINLMRERGNDLNDAIQMSGESRLRPVLMTAFTTILGMVPMAVSQGEGAEMWQPLGIVVIGGLTVSTFLTLYIVPVLYGVMSKKGERDKLKKVRENFIFMDIDVKDCEETQNS